MLIVLDINGVLCETAALGSRCSCPSEADFIARKKLVYLRPRLDAFLDFLFEHFDVAVWTSCPYFSAIPLVDVIFGARRARLKFIFTRLNCDLLKNYGSKKNLETVWRLHPQFTPRNTLLLEDDADKVVQYDQWVDVKRYRHCNQSTDTEFEDLTRHLKLWIDK